MNQKFRKSGGKILHFSDRLRQRASQSGTLASLLARKGPMVPWMSQSLAQLTRGRMEICCSCVIINSCYSIVISYIIVNQTITVEPQVTQEAEVCFLRCQIFAVSSRIIAQRLASVQSDREVSGSGSSQGRLDDSVRCLMCGEKNYELFGQMICSLKGTLQGRRLKRLQCQTMPFQMFDRLDLMALYSQELCLPTYGVTLALANWRAFSSKKSSYSYRSQSSFVLAKSDARNCYICSEYLLLIEGRSLQRVGNEALDVTRRQHFITISFNCMRSQPCSLQQTKGYLSLMEPFQSSRRFQRFRLECDRPSLWRWNKPSLTLLKML